LEMLNRRLGADLRALYRPNFYPKTAAVQVRHTQESGANSAPYVDLIVHLNEP